MQTFPGSRPQPDLTAAEAIAKANANNPHYLQALENASISFDNGPRPPFRLHQPKARQNAPNQATGRAGTIAGVIGIVLVAGIWALVNFGAFIGFVGFLIPVVLLTRWLESRDQAEKYDRDAREARILAALKEKPPVFTKN